MYPMEHIKNHLNYGQLGALSMPDRGLIEASSGPAWSMAGRVGWRTVLPLLLILLYCAHPYASSGPTKIARQAACQAGYLLLPYGWSVRFLWPFYVADQGLPVVKTRVARVASPCLRNVPRPRNCQGYARLPGQPRDACNRPSRRTMQHEQPGISSIRAKASRAGMTDTAVARASA